jgi:hypothetical protein
MHRSGTSALSGVLAKLGARPPATPILGDRNNPRGYWESDVLGRFHDKVLESAGTRWSDWDRFNEGWIDSPISRGFMDELASHVKREYGGAPLFLVKDPRMCRLLPLWLKVLDELGVVPKVVIPIRHPLEVSNSLATRDNFTQTHARLLWLRHNLEAEFDTRALTRVFVRYTDLLKDWQSQVEEISTRLEIKWPRMSASTKAEIDAYLAPELRHHVAPAVDAMASSASAGIVSWVETAFRAMECLVNDPGQSEGLATLDAIRRQFNETAEIYAPIVQELRMGYEEVLEREVALTEAVSKAEALQVEANAKTEELASRTAELNAEIKRLQSAYRQADEAAHEGHLEIAQLTKLLLETEERLAADRALARDEIAGQKEQLENVREAMRASNEELARQQARLEDALRTIRALKGEIEEQRRLVLEYRSSLDRIHASRYWRLATSLRGLGKPGKVEKSDPARGISDEELIAQSALFDKQWYLDRYPDVRAAGADPLAHYLAHGVNEGRDPSAAFSTSGYLVRYPDVPRGLNPLAHYLRYGRGEGRSISASEDENGH